MTTIAIKKPFTFAERISVIVNDECNHEGAEYVEHTQEYINEKGDLTATETIEVLTCTCGAWWDETFNWWEIP